MEQRYEALRLGNQLCFPVYLCAKELTRRYQPMLDEIGLTYTQYVVMMYLWEVGSASAGDASRTLLLDPSTLTPVLKTLEQKGFLNRTRDPADERSLIITLTESGAALREKALDIPARMGSCLGLSESEARALTGLIGKVLDHLEKEK